MRSERETTVGREPRESGTSRRGEDESGLAPTASTTTPSDPFVRPAAVSVSVCIAACNEAHGIETAVRSALAQRCIGTIEVLVCANGCSDATAEIAREISQEDPRVRVIETPIRGKPNAWNLLRENAFGRVLFFMDADVFIVPGSFELLAKALEREPGIVAAGARCIPINLSGDRISRLTAPPVGRILCLNGGLYAASARRLSERFRERGFARMPLDLICEDLWLTMVIGKRGWREVPLARALHVLPKLRERVLTDRRNRWGLRQLRREYRSLHREFGQTYLRRARAFALRALRAGSIASASRVLAGTLLFRLTVLCTMGVSPHGPWLRKWRSASSSKRLVPLLPAHAAAMASR